MVVVLYFVMIYDQRSNTDPPKYNGIIRARRGFAFLSTSRIASLLADLDSCMHVELIVELH